MHLCVCLVAVFIVIGAGSWPEATRDFFQFHPSIACEPIEGDNLEWDQSFSCPDLRLKLRTVCVDHLADCPPELKCTDYHDEAYGHNTAYEICAGSCVPVGLCDMNKTENPCACGVSCHIVKLTESDFEVIEAGFFNGTLPQPTCPENYTASTSDKVDTEYNLYNKDESKAFMIWLAVVPGALILWCIVNQRIIGCGLKPVQVLMMSQDGDDKKRFMQQTGYQFSFVGYLIYISTLITIVYIQFCLTVLCVSYYGINNGYGWVLEKSEVPSARRALYSFQLVWMVGAGYHILLLWPSQLSLHFMLRSSLEKATSVRVWVPSNSALLSAGSERVQTLDKLSNFLLYVFNSFFAFIYSDVTLPTKVKGSWVTCKVTKTADGQRVIQHHMVNLVYTPSAGGFLPFYIPPPPTIKTMRDKANGNGLTDEEAAMVRSRVGPNLLNIDYPWWFVVVLEEFCKPFHTYQIFMAWTWFNFGYWHMGLINVSVFTLSGLSISMVTYLNRKQLFKIVSAATNHTIMVKRGGRYVKAKTTMLVPGDLVAVEGGLVCADMALIAGQAVLDESSLTGESQPVHKITPDKSQGSALFSRTLGHKKSTILAGTTVIQGSTWDQSGNPSTVGLVLTTGPDTEKGKLVAGILFQEPARFKFDVQVKFVVLYLMLYACFMFWLTCYFLAEDPIYAWFYGMYVVGTAMPPLLPSVFIVSVGIAASRLRPLGIMCTDPHRLLAAGKVTVCCFDKTGTLTNSEMDFRGVRAYSNGKVGELKMTVTRGSTIEKAMASCHELSKIGSSFFTIQHVKNKAPNVKLHLKTDTLLGTAVDVKMFAATGWDLLQGDDGNVVSSPDGTRLAVVKRFEFDHHRMTSSVVARDESGRYTLYVKGSTESVAKLLAEQPGDAFFKAAGKDSRAGFYVLALASRECTAQEIAEITMGTINRDAAEARLELVGQISFKNELKPDSKDAIDQLAAGGCKNLMLTGDHILTAISVAKECSFVPADAKVLRSVSIGEEATLASIEWQDMADNTQKLDLKEDSIELVMLGEIWRKLPVADQTILLPYVRIWARTSPTDKLEVIKLIVAKGHITSMCGDGGNDCGALRAAHVGVALSDSEASIVSPFTSLNKTCMSVVDTLRNGRGCLATSFACYKYLIMYGQIETVNQVINAYFSITFCEWSWVFMDGFWVVTMFSTLGFAKPASKLSSVRPPSNLFGAYTMGTLVGVLLIHFFFIVIALGALFSQPWFQCRIWDPDSADLGDVFGIGDNYETTVIFLVSGAQYLSSAMALNFGHKHRQPWIYNKYFVALLVVFIVIQLHITLTPSWLSCIFHINCEGSMSMPGVLDPCPHPIGNPWNTTVMPVSFRWALFGIIVANTVAVMCWEYLVILGPVGAWIRSKRPRKPSLLRSKPAERASEQREPERSWA